MDKKELRLSVFLDTLGIVSVIVGVMLLISVLNSCTITKRVTTDTNTTHTETIDVDTTYKSSTVTLPFTGDQSTNIESNVQVQYRDSVIVRDSINVKDSIVYFYKLLDTFKYKVNHPPIYTFTKYGYAKAWMNNNKLGVDMVVKDGIIQAEIDSAIQVITINKESITDTITTTNTVKEKRSFLDIIGRYLLVIFSVVLLILVVYLLIKKYFTSWGKFW